MPARHPFHILQKMSMNMTPPTSFSSSFCTFSTMLADTYPHFAYLQYSKNMLLKIQTTNLVFSGFFGIFMSYTKIQMEIKCNMDLIFNFFPLLLRILWENMGNKGNYCKKNPGKNLQATLKTPTHPHHLFLHFCA